MERPRILNLLCNLPTYASPSFLGMSFVNEERWKILRRLFVATMRDFGIGKQSVEDQIKEEAKYLVEELKNHQGKTQRMGIREDMSAQRQRVTHSKVETHTHHTPTPTQAHKNIQTQHTVWRG